MKWLSSHLWIAYVLLFLIGGIVSYSFIDLNEAQKEQYPIIFNPADPVVIRDTVTIENVKWRTPIYRQCCCQKKEKGMHEKEQEIQERIPERGSTTSSSETALSESTLEETKTP